MAQITELTFDQCMQLLGTGQIGRVAMSTPMGPQVIPVNYAMYDGDIVFRTTPYSVLGTFGWNCELAFEIDHIDEEAREGWSVVAVGKAHIIDDVDEITQIRLTGDPRPWADGARHLYLRLMVRDLTGRRVGGNVRAPTRPLTELLTSNYLG